MSAPHKIFCHAAGILFLPVFFYSSHSFGQQTEVPDIPQIKTYEDLVREVQAQRGDSADEGKPSDADRQEAVRKAWVMGKLIEDYVTRNLGDLTYKAELTKRLSADSGILADQLTVRMKFAREYPHSPPASPLSWSHYKRLLNINDLAERERLKKEAELKGWSIRELGEEVVKWNRFQAQGREAFLKENKIPSSGPGKPYAYHIVTVQTGPDKGKLALDLGLANYYAPEGMDIYKEGDAVTLEEGKLKPWVGPPDSFYTYHAEITQINDGDTVHAVVDLGFHLTIEQRLRLNWIDTPELGMPGGMEAREFLRDAIAKADGRVIVKIGKPDKFNRYLAEIWVDKKSLNQKLIDGGFAVLMRDEQAA